MPRRAAIAIAFAAILMTARGLSAADPLSHFQVAYWSPTIEIPGEEDPPPALRTAIINGANPLERGLGGELPSDAPGAVQYDIVFSDDGAAARAVDPWNDPTLRLSDYKSGFFQKADASAAWIPGGGGIDLGIVEYKSFTTVALPLPTVDHPLLITGGTETRYLQGPAMPDVPPRLYSLYLQLMWVPKITERLSAVFGVTPGYYSDFEHFDSDALRFQGFALARYQVIPYRLQFLLGVAYLDRPDLQVLPAGGLLWYPTENLRFDLVAPYPKVGYRVAFDGIRERWLYAAGEIGGDSWSVERQGGPLGGANDLLALRDLRLNLGFETKRDGGRGWRVEAGYVFGRNLRYVSAASNVLLDDTFMLRGGVSF